MATTHEITAQTYYRTFSRTHPVLGRIAPGDTVRTKTLDAGGQDEHGVRRSDPANPLTGPFVVEGAEPGDALLVRFDRVRCNRDWGFSANRLRLVGLLPETVEGIYSNQYREDMIRPGRADLVPWNIDLAAQTVSLREPRPGVARLQFPISTMVGCFGVAPAGDFVPTSLPSGTYGGNVDYNLVGEGATVILPVSHAGAFLYVGDGHALQADGEPLGTAVETSMDVEFTVEVHRGAAPAGPRVETADCIASIGSQPEFVSDLDRALQMATSDMVDWLAQDYGLPAWEAHLLIGMVGRYDVVTVAGSMALRVAKAHLPARQR